MSSIANCHTSSALLSESDNDDENEFDSSYNRQNESMMHKVKDVVSKLLHPSFLFSADNTDTTTAAKRKRSISIDVNEEKQKTDTTSQLQNRRISTTNDEPQLTDDEDSNSRDVPSAEPDVIEVEQQKKRRRTANYQHILHEDERASSPSISNDGVRSLSNLRNEHTSNTTPVIFRTTIEQNYNERLNRLTPSRQRSNILPTYRGSTSTYDPSKSPLFSVNNRRTTESSTTTNVKLNEFSANHLLATGLINRPQSSTSNNHQSPATLSNPTINNRLLSNERQMLGVNYASINSRRLPYIERLRRRTLQDCIRLNRTLDSEPLSISTLEEHKSTTTTPVPKRTKLPDKECGIQCDISIVEPNKKIQRTFPPEDIRDEALSIPTIGKIQSSSQTDLPIQTNSSITIERIQPSIPIIEITKPKVLGNITPFSWPKFARAQEEYAKKYPEKCRDDALVPNKSSVSPATTTSATLQQTAIPQIPMFSFTSSRPTTEAIWKCPSCTKEHPAQTAFCSLCRGRNPDYRKLSATESTVTTEKEPVTIIPVSTANTTIPTTTTKENISTIPPTVTTSAPSWSFPSFGTTPTTKENTPISTTSLTSSSTIPSFGSTPTVTPTTTKENIVSTSASQPSFGVTPIISTSPATTTKENTTTTSTSPSFTAAITKENPVTTSAPSSISTFPPFGVTTTTSLSTTTKENPVTTSAPFAFGIVTTSSATSPIQFGTASSTNLTPAVTASPVPSVITTTSNIPTSSLRSTPISFGQFGTTTTATTTPVAPIISTVMTSPTNLFPFGVTPATSAATTSTVTPSISFGSSSTAPVPVPTTTTATISFPVSSAASTFTSPSGLTFPSTTTTTSAAPTFGSSNFGFGPLSTTTATTTAAASVAPAFGTSNFGSGPLSTTTATTTAAASVGPAFGTSSFSLTPALSTATTTSPAPVFGSSSSSSFAPALTTTTPSGPSFGISTGSPIRSFTSTSIASITPSTSSPFGTSIPFGQNLTAATDKTASSVAPFQFGFGSTSTTTTNPTQSSTTTAGSSGGFQFGTSTSTIPPATTGGFSFGTQSSTVPPMATTGFQFSATSSITPPVFGSGPPSLATVTPFNASNLGGTPASGTSPPVFAFSAPTSTSIGNPAFAAPMSSDSAETGSLFTIGSGGESSTNQRLVLRAKRRQRP